MRRFSLPAFAAVGMVVVALAGCGTDAAAPAASGAVTVTATDSECVLSQTSVTAGTTVFTIVNNGSKINEFYLYADGDRVVGEVENIGPGLSRDLHVELAAGTYQTACKPGMSGSGIRAAFTVTGSAQPLSSDGKLAAATATYQRYVRAQSDGLLAKTQEFADAVKAGDVAKAKALYPVARTYWERIEPVAEAFGDLDPKIDGREEVIDEGMPFTGFHRLEKDLWATGDISRSGPIADQLMADVKQIVAKANVQTLSPLQLANGAKELLDEVATTKITGEEDRYSHTDLWDFAANVEGCKAAIAALRPVIEERQPALVTTLDEKFAAVEVELRRHATAGGWRLHNQLSQAELKALSDAINALAEPVSKVAAVVSGR